MGLKIGRIQPKGISKARAGLLNPASFHQHHTQVEMGHSTITVTYDLYGKLFKDDEGARKARAERLASELF